VEIAGPDQFRLDELIRGVLSARNDPRVAQERHGQGGARDPLSPTARSLSESEQATLRGGPLSVSPLSPIRIAR
jgi:hypothetical protein